MRGGLLWDFAGKNGPIKPATENMPAGYVALLPPVDQTWYSTYTKSRDTDLRTFTHTRLTNLGKQELGKKEG